MAQAWRKSLLSTAGRVALWDFPRFSKQPEWIKAPCKDCAHAEGFEHEKAARAQGLDGF
jgi:hypothetical protein